MSLVHLHLLINHLPIIGVPIGVALLAWAILARERTQQRMALVLLVVVGAAAGLVFLTGEPAEDAIENIAGVSKSMIERHETVATATIVATHLLWVMGAVALFVSRRQRPVPKPLVRMTLGVAMIAAGLLAGTAWLGGQIRHSEISGPTAVDEERRLE